MTPLEQSYMKRFASLFAIVFLITAFPAPPVQAAERKPKASSQGLSELKTALKLPSSCKQLSLDVLTADVLIKNEKRDSIEIKVNYPKHWTVDDSGTVKQTEYAKCTPGIYRTQNGNNYMGMGTVPGDCKINISVDGITINGRSVRLERKVSKPGQSGVEMNQEGIFVNGRKAAPMTPLPGNDSELDVIQILVPEDNRASLNLQTHSSFATKVDGWVGTELRVNATGRGTVDLKNVTAPCVLSASNGAHIKVEKLECSSLVAEAAVQGDIEVNTLNCANASVRVSEAGSVHLCEGKVDVCEAQVRSQAQFTLGESRGNDLCIKSSTVNLDVSGTTKTFLMNTEITFLSIRRSDAAKVHIAGTIARIEESNGAEGSLIFTDLKKVKVESSNP